MFDINLNNVKKGKNIFYIFLVTGILIMLAISAAFAFSIIKFNRLDASVLSDHVEVESYFDDEGDIMYSSIYYFNVDDNNYVCSSHNSSSYSPSTENKLVYYNSNNPTDCMTEDSKSGNYILLAFLILPILFISASVVNIIKIDKRIKIILELNNIGKLVKNLPYKLEDTGMVIGGRSIQRPVVEYTLPSGSQITLYGDPRNDKKQLDEDGMVDLLIDENNPDNYFIDFEINRLSGNLPQDYYVSTDKSQ